jgi:hypothetical protein
MARERSAATQARYYRRLLQNSLVGFRLMEDPGVSDDYRRNYAHDMVRLIREELAPKRLRGGTR